MFVKHKPQSSVANGGCHERKANEFPGARRAPLSLLLDLGNNANGADDTRKGSHRELRNSVAPRLWRCDSCSRVFIFCVVVSACRPLEVPPLASARRA